MREQRKVVTVLFADVVGSTSMASESDPEVIRARMSRYFQRITDIAQLHGGMVEKFAGDSAMLLFGVPAAHDDDAERAVRAALEIRDSAAELAVRIGVSTGEAVTAAREDRQQLVTGDTVNVAARLQQGADPGEIVVGALTERLTRSVIEYAPRAPVVAKGKSEPLAAFRALRARTDVPSQARGLPGLRSPLVGRDRELRLLVDTYTRVAADRRSHLFTLVGPPGIGKSRLVDEALAAIAAAGARIMRGRCLPYGRGITYWPLVEIIRQDMGIALTDDRGAALAKLERQLGEMLPGSALVPALRARLSVMMGFEQPAAVMSDTPGERVQREIAWAVRHYVEAISRSGPVVLVVDDIQWAEPPMLDIITQLGERLSEVPAMLICIARPEFLEKQPGWGAGQANSSTISLSPLSATETGALISHLLEVEALPAGLRTQIIDRSAGTPLFCEELIRMLVDEGGLVRQGSHWHSTNELQQISVPPSITAVLTARLDGLPEGDRAVLQAASVIGQRFTASELVALFAGAEVDTYLESLRRKGLVTGDDAPDSEMSFSHLLVRDAAYASLTKSERASLHDRFSSVLESKVDDAQQVSEILAHHTERAFRLSTELGLEGEVVELRARRALTWSLTMADRASARRDRLVLDSALKVAAAAAAALDDSGGEEPRARLALLEAQRAVIVADYPEARRLAATAAGIAEAAGLDKVLAAARLTEAWIWNWAGAGSLGDFELAAKRAIDACTRAGDVSGSIEARFIATNAYWSLGKLDKYTSALRSLADEARAAGSRHHLAAIMLRLGIAETVRGNTESAASLWPEVEAIAAELGLRDITMRLNFHMAVETWYAGDLEGGEQRLRQHLADAMEAGGGQETITSLRFQSLLHIRQGRFERAVQLLDQALELSHTTGERWNRSELYAFRAEAGVGLGDIGAAEHFAEQAVDVRSPEDFSAVVISQRALGLVRQAQGREAEAENALRRAREMSLTTDYYPDRIEAALSLAEFLAQHGRRDEAHELLAEVGRMTAKAGWHTWDSWIQRAENIVPE